MDDIYASKKKLEEVIQSLTQQLEDAKSDVFGLGAELTTANEKVNNANTLIIQCRNLIHIDNVHENIDDYFKNNDVSVIT